MELQFQLPGVSHAVLNAPVQVALVQGAGLKVTVSVVAKALPSFERNALAENEFTSSPDNNHPKFDPGISTQL